MRKTLIFLLILPLTVFAKDISDEYKSLNWGEEVDGVKIAVSNFPEVLYYGEPLEFKLYIWQENNKDKIPIYKIFNGNVLRFDLIDSKNIYVGNEYRWLAASKDIFGNKDNTNAYNIRLIPKYEIYKYQYFKIGEYAIKANLLIRVNKIFKKEFIVKSNILRFKIEDYYGHAKNSPAGEKTIKMNVDELIVRALPFYEKGIDDKKMLEDLKKPDWQLHIIAIRSIARTNNKEIINILIEDLYNGKYTVTRTIMPVIGDPYYVSVIPEMAFDALRYLGEDALNSLEYYYNRIKKEDVKMKIKKLIDHAKDNRKLRIKP